MVEMFEIFKALIPSKSFGLLGKVLLILFSVAAVFSIGSFLVLDQNAMLSCNPDKSVATDATGRIYVQTVCSNIYEKEFNSPISLKGLVILTFVLPVVLSYFYSVLIVTPRVEKFDKPETTTPSYDDVRVNIYPSSQEDRGETRSQVFYFHVSHLLLLRFMALLVFAGFLLCRANFPTKFSCPWSSTSTTNSSSAINKTTFAVPCESTVAWKYNLGAYAVSAVAIVFALFGFGEAIYLIREAVLDKIFPEDAEFCTVYLLRKKKRLRKILEKINAYKRSLPEDAFKVYVQYCTKGTVEKMYVRVIIREGREDSEKALHVMFKDKMQTHELYDTYLKVPEEGILIKEIEDLFHSSQGPKRRPRKILVVGRPGIGKTVLTKKILFSWAKGLVEFYNGKILILLKFRSFNCPQNKLKNFRDVLRIGAQTANNADFDDLYAYILANPEKLILVFDGLDELELDRNCFTEEDATPNDYNEPMPIFSIFKKLIDGKFLPGATVITTSRPTADALYSKLSPQIDRVVEILGFTEAEIEEYVTKFCRNTGQNKGKDMRAKMWTHIKQSVELLSLCYIPINCFIVCLTLKECFEQEESEFRIGNSLPKTLTELYKRAIRIIMWDHHPACKGKVKEKDYLNFDHLLPKEVKDILSELKTLAQSGMESNKLIFGLEKTHNCAMFDCGLFNSLPDENKAQYCFLHLSIQEFLAACNLIDLYDQRTDVEMVLSEYLEDPRWHLVIQFFAGLLGDRIRKKKKSEKMRICKRYEC